MITLEPIDGTQQNNLSNQKGLHFGPIWSTPDGILHRKTQKEEKFNKNK